MHHFSKTPLYGTNITRALWSI